MALGQKDSEIVINQDKTGLTGPRLDDALKELNDSITAEDIFDRISTTIVPKNAGDDLDMGTGKYLVGSNTEISETGGSTLLENKSPTGFMYLKLGDLAGVTKVRILASNGSTVATIDSQGKIEFAIGLNGVVEAKDQYGVVQERLNAVGDNYSKNLYMPVGKVTLADDAQTQVSSSKSGYGMVNIGNNQEWAMFSFSTTAVQLINNSANVDNADTDTKLCIYYSGANLYIKNRLGSSLSVRYTIWHSS
ncbi:MAG: hypothetical protein FK734_20075 [Asgard group archaeon]|nr:hypothetical protein [Asgard group archaeon]